MFLTFCLNLPLRWVEKYLKTLIILEIINNLRKFVKFWLLPKYLSQKLTKALHPEIVSCIILTSFILFLGQNFNIYMVNIRRVYATNKNKVSITIWSPTVFRVWFFLNKFVIYVHYLINIHALFPIEFCIIHYSWNLIKFIIVYYVPRRIMRVFTRRATMLAGDRSQEEAGARSVLRAFQASLVITRIVCIGTYSILCDFGAYTSFYAYTRIQSEKVKIAVIIAHLTWHFATTSSYFDFLHLV